MQVQKLVLALVAVLVVGIQTRLHFQSVQHDGATHPFPSESDSITSPALEGNRGSRRAVLRDRSLQQVGAARVQQNVEEVAESPLATAKRRNLAASSSFHNLVSIRSDAAGHGAAAAGASVATNYFAQRDNTASEGGMLQALDLAGSISSSLLSLTFTNGAYKELMLNWVLHFRKLKRPYVVAVFDESAAQYCQANGIRWMWANSQLQSSDFRKDLKKFRLMGSLKPLLVSTILRTGRYSAVALSDTDVSWLRDPAELLTKQPAADIMISTDCLSHNAEVNREVNHFRCGHVAGSNAALALNTGVIVFRNTPATLAVLDRWHKELADSNKNTTVLDKNGNPTGLRLTDQMEFNLLMNRILPGKLLADPANPDLLLGSAFGEPFRLWALPVEVAAAGHTYFYQRLPQNLGVTPYVVHTTFQRHGKPAKMVRFREEGIWLEQDPAAYYDANARYITYENNVRQYVELAEARWRARHGREMAQHHKHMLAAQYQIAAAQDAFAIAHALKRVLVFPAFTCYCDQDYYANVLEHCVMAGTDLTLPFECSADVFLVTDLLEQWHSRSHPYRLKSFLTSPDLPESVKRSRMTVVMLPSPVASMSIPRSVAVPDVVSAGGANAEAGSEAGSFSSAARQGLVASIAHLMQPTIDQQQLQLQQQANGKGVALPLTAAIGGGSSSSSSSSGTYAVLPMHLNDVQIRSVLEPLQDASVLDLRGFVPGSFGGFAAPQDAKAFDNFFHSFTVGIGWCCTGSFDQWDLVYWKFTLPQHVVERAGDVTDTVLPPLRRPDWCDEAQKKLNTQNKAVLQYPNHPCNYHTRAGS